MDIRHTLWVFDAVAGLKDFRNKSLPDVMDKLNREYLANCVGAVPHAGSTDKIVSADAKQVTGQTVPAGLFDAVVFLVKDDSQSFGPKIGGAFTSSPDVLGRTFLGTRGGGLSEVYWNKCYSSKELAASIFHEAAHLKSGLDNSMHNARVGAPHGGPGLKVLSANGSSFFSPSLDDFDFYSIAIPRHIIVRTRVP